MKFKSFTLLELLIIIAIIGILVTLLVPSLKATRESGMSAVSKSNLRQIYTGFLDYAKKNNGAFPRYRISQARNVCFWTRELKDYFGSDLAFDIMRIPGVTYQNGQWSGYSGSHALTGFRDNGSLDNKYVGRKIISMVKPAETYLLFEGFAKNGNNAEGRVTWGQVQNDKSAVSASTARNLNFLYNERMNWVNVDGAVSSLHFNSRQLITASQWKGL